MVFLDFFILNYYISAFFYIDTEKGKQDIIDTNSR